jgi:hypothetical protein
MARQKIFGLVVGLICAIAVTGGTASAHHQDTPTVIAFTVQNLGEPPAGDCSGFLFGLSFDMVSPSGPVLGKGVSCVRSIKGCQFAGCRDTVKANFTLDFGRGSVTARVVLEELWLTDTTIQQITTGKVRSGTGDFAGARGSLFCGGTLEFAATGPIPNIVCVVQLNGSKDDDD